MNVFIKYMKLFHRQLLHRKIYFWTLFIVFIVMSFADDRRSLVYSLNHIMYRYTTQQMVMVFIPILLVPICLNESYQNLNERLCCIYNRSNLLPKIALWFLLTAVSCICLFIGVCGNRAFQIQFFRIPKRLCAFYLVVCGLELASAFGIFIGLFKIFKRVFITEAVYSFLVFSLMLVPLFRPFSYAHLMGFPLAKSALDMLQYNPMLVIGSRLVYFVLAVILMFRKEKAEVKNE